MNAVPDSFIAGKNDVLDKQVQMILAAEGNYKGAIDGKFGPLSKTALADYDKSHGILRGDVTWGWVARIDGNDLSVLNIKATCFGGVNDSMDSGKTASGVMTKGNPGLMGCSLPMDGRMFKKMSDAEHAALDGCPIPRLPWQTTRVRVSRGNTVIEAPLIDIGPAKSASAKSLLPHALDLTVAAAKCFDPKATANSFEAVVSYRILGAAIGLRF